MRLAANASPIRSVISHHELCKTCCTVVLLYCSNDCCVDKPQINQQTPTRLQNFPVQGFQGNAQLLWRLICPVQQSRQTHAAGDLQYMMPVHP